MKMINIFTGEQINTPSFCFKHKNIYCSFDTDHETIYSDSGICLEFENTKEIKECIEYLKLLKKKGDN